MEAFMEPVYYPIIGVFVLLCIYVVYDICTEKKRLKALVEHDEQIMNHYENEIEGEDVTVRNVFFRKEIRKFENESDEINRRKAVAKFIASATYTLSGIFVTYVTILVAIFGTQITGDDQKFLQDLFVGYIIYGVFLTAAFGAYLLHLEDKLRTYNARMRVLKDLINE